MKIGRILLRGTVSLTLFRHHMDQNSVIQLLGLPQHLAESLDIMAVHRAQIGNAHIFKQHAGYKQLFYAVLGAFDFVYHGSAHHRDPVQSVCHALFQVVVAAACAQAVQVAGHAPYIFRNRHLIVIQHNDKILLHPGGIVQSLVRHAAGKGPVSNDGYHTVVLPPDIAPQGNAQSSGYGGGAVACVKGIVGTLLSLGKSAQAPVLAELVKFRHAPA